MNATLIPLHSIQVESGTKHEQKEYAKKLTALKFRIFVLQSMLKYLYAVFPQTSKSLRQSKNDEETSSRQIIWKEDKQVRITLFHSILLQ
jgi:hypothetical protein